MPIHGWQDELIQAAAKWPRSLRARLSNGIWELFGAPMSVQDEFRKWAERIQHELQFSRSGIDIVGALLYRLKANGAYVRSGTVSRKNRTCASAEERATIRPLRSALVKYVTFGRVAAPTVKSTPCAATGHTGQVTAATRNRVYATRVDHHRRPEIGDTNRRLAEARSRVL